MKYKIKRMVDKNDKEKIYEVFNECYTKYGKLVYFVISKYVYDQHDNEDLTNEVFISFFNNLETLDITRNIKNYLTTSAKNTAINYIKKNKKMEYNDEYITMIPDQPTSAYNDLVLEMSSCLTKEEIDIIIEHVVYDVKFKDLAEEYHKPLNTIISIYHRAIKKFRKFKGV